MPSPILTSISRENVIETPLTSKKRRQAKFCLVDAWSQALLFTGETSFSSRFFFNNPEISAQIQKPTKYQSTDNKELFDIFSEGKAEGKALEKLCGEVMRKDEYAYLQSMRTDHVGKFEGVDKT